MTDEVRARLHEIWEQHPSDDAAELARRFLDLCDKDDLVPLIADLFRGITRDHTRDLEVEAIRTMKASPRRRAAVSDFADLLDQPYRIGDGVPRTFGQMTVDEHRMRILLLHGQMSGIQRSIEIHEHAVALIRRNRVACLDDLVDAQAA